MAAGICNLYIQQGETFSRTITITNSSTPAVPFDLTGYSARASIRQFANSPATIADFTCTITNILGGVLKIALTAAQTTALPTPGKTAYNDPARFQWDLELYSSTEVIRLLNGAVDVSPEITK